MNSIELIGRITKKPELRYTPSNKEVCEFNLAVSRMGQEQTDFINCTVWGKQAENLCKYQDKGCLIAVSGALRVDVYEVNGEKRYKTYVLANQIEYLGSKRADQSSTKANNEIPTEEDPFTYMANQVRADFEDEEGLPW